MKIALKMGGGGPFEWGDVCMCVCVCFGLQAQ